MAGKTLIYVGAEAEGLYRKEAEDDRWEALTNGLAPSTQVRAIAIHPETPSTIFAGTQTNNNAVAPIPKPSGTGHVRADIVAENTVVGFRIFDPDPVAVVAENHVPCP